MVRCRLKSASTARTLLAGVALIAMAVQAASTGARRLGAEPPSAAPASATDDGLALLRLRAENARLRERVRLERARAQAFESELARLSTKWLERELAWRDFHGQLGALRGGVAAAADLARALELEMVDERARRLATKAAAEARVDAARGRAETTRLRFNALLAVEGFRGFELFDAGVLASDADLSAGDGPRHGTGPVVVRLLDHRGVLCGSLSAERLHLEASRSGHSLTIVLTNGVHREGASQRPFDGGVYRIPLRHVDPKPFIEDCPELFDPTVVERVVDDGRWSLPALGLALDRLLGERVTGTNYRIVWFGGVVGDELRDVELVAVGEDGRELRRIVADGLSIELHRDHVRLVLRDGLTLAGDARAPFLDGRMRIVLTGSDPARWRAARVPSVEVAGAVPPAAEPTRGSDASGAAGATPEGPATTDGAGDGA
jgi:hypothetical protein